jgi:hypothetical protein
MKVLNKSWQSTIEVFITSLGDAIDLPIYVEFVLPVVTVEAQTDTDFSSHN